jgi:glycosyltransferase involved in cell wall biosynthesis
MHTHRIMKSEGREALRKDKVPLSVIIPVKNEEANIGACIDSVAWADQIFVVDSRSSDATCEIAAAKGARVVQFAFTGGWPKKKNWALENLPFAHDWVLLLDADERVPAALAGEISSHRRDPKGCDGFYMNRRMLFLGRWIRHCGWYPSWNLRFFRHSKGRFERLTTADPGDTGDVEVHEHVILDGRPGYLEHDLLHEDFKNISHFIDRHNRYSTWEAAVYREFRRGRSEGQTIGAALGGTPLVGRADHRGRVGRHAAAAQTVDQADVGASALPAGAALFLDVPVPSRHPGWAARLHILRAHELS